MPAPQVSVVVPTRDRRPTLATTLARIGSQRLPFGSFEVVVVDNGSTDGTPAMVAERVGGFPVRLRLLAEPRPGPAAARNRGWRAAEGGLVLFLGDDMEPADEHLVAGHLAAHAPVAAGGVEDRIVMGRATWTPRAPVTPFMRWLEARGPQFDFAGMSPGPVPTKRLCTANISFPRALLERVDGFDERFPHAALEDTELGIRLERLGAVLIFEPRLLTHHDHPTDLADSLRRMGRVGASGRLYNRLHPERPLAEIPVPRGLSWRVLGALRALARPLASERLPRGLRERAWAELHLRAYADGYGGGSGRGG